MRKEAATASILILMVFGLAAFSSISPAQKSPDKSPSRIYYVATDGNDAHDGLAPARQKGSRGPFRTLMRAARAVMAGDTVQIRAGTYQASSTWMADGTSAAPIKVTNYGGEAVVIDGKSFKIPGGENDVLLQVYGDWYTVGGLEVRYSSGYGVAVHGEHCTVENLYAHHNWGSGIYMTGSHGLIAGCRASDNSLINERFRPHKGTWGFGISACRHPQDTTIRGCTAWANWGEGISTFESQHITIEDCVSYNNQQNFYISDTKFCLFQRNLSYFTPGNAIQGYVTPGRDLARRREAEPAVVGQHRHQQPGHGRGAELRGGGRPDGERPRGEQHVRQRLSDRRGGIGLRLFLQRELDRRPVRQQYHPPGGPRGHQPP